MAGPGKKGKKRFPMLLITFIFVALLMAAMPYARGYLVKTYGFEAVPKTVVPVKAAQAFLQNDAGWAEDKIGGSGLTMGSHGCLVSCIATALNDLGIVTDPKAVNAALTEGGGYTPDGEVIWNKLNEIFGVSYSYMNDFSSDTLEKLLQKGLLPIVRVKYRGGGAEHWVIVVGSSKDDFLALDPLEPSGKPIPLKTHGKVYAYRVLEKGGIQ